MEQRFYHYTKWEDFRNGMYDEDKHGREGRVSDAMRLLTDTELLYEQMTRVTMEWTFATEQNLTNKGMNHQAFLGQTACSIWHGIHEDETREAWGRMTREQRRAANGVADAVYNEWVRRFTANEPNYQQALFD